MDTMDRKLRVGQFTRGECKEQEPLAQPVKAFREIDEVFENKYKVTEELCSTIEKLKERLATVLRPNEPKNIDVVQKETKSEKPLSAPMVEYIVMDISKTQEIIDQLNMLMARMVI